MNQYVNLRDYDFGAPGSSRLPEYEIHEWDHAIHQLSLSFSATFALDVLSYEDAMTDNGAFLLLQLHQELSLASLMPIDYNNVISINSRQAKAGKFYTNAKAFFEDGHEEEMLFKEYFDLDSSAEEDKYILSPITHPTETDKQFYLPYYIHM